MVKRGFKPMLRKGLVDPTELRLRRQELLKNPSAEKKKRLINELLVSDSRAVFQRACIRASGLHLSKKTTTKELKNAIRTLYMNGAYRAKLRGDEKAHWKLLKAADEKNVEKVAERVFKSIPVKKGRRDEKASAGLATGNASLAVGTAILSGVWLAMGETEASVLLGSSSPIMSTSSHIFSKGFSEKRGIDKYKRKELKKKIDEYKKLKEEWNIGLFFKTGKKTQDADLKDIKNMKFHVH
jgi:hypothetical protein